jgi:hypothetical protein
VVVFQCKISVGDVIIHITAFGNGLDTVYTFIFCYWGIVFISRWVNRFCTLLVQVFHVLYTCMKYKLMNFWICHVHPAAGDHFRLHYVFHMVIELCDRLCDLVVRVLDYRSWGPGFDSRALQKKSSGSGTGSTQPREYN